MFLKKLFTGLIFITIMSIASFASAAAWVVCDPQDDADGYKYTMDGGEWVTTAYEEVVYSGVVYAKVAFVEEVAVGNHHMEVKAFLNSDTGYKESAVVPFDFTKPREGWDGSIGSPTGFKVIPIP